jgi:heme-degrading monooxygenase HmoA
MLVQQVTLAVLGGQETAFEAALCESRQRVFMSAGFRGFAALQGAEHPSTYLVTVHWETLEELAAFGESGRFERCWAPVRPFLAGPPRVEHFVERPGLGLNGPGVITDLGWLST